MRVTKEKRLAGMLVVIPEIFLSVNVGKNVVGERKSYLVERKKIRESE